MFGVQVLSWLVLLVCLVVGFVVGSGSGPRGFKVGALAVGALAIGLAVALHVGVDDGQPFVVQTGRYSDNDDVTDDPRGWLYLRTLLMDVGVGLLAGAAVMWLAKRRDRRKA